MCRTRCLSRIPGLETFLEFYEALVKTFEEIYHKEEGKFNRDSVKKAFWFLSLITTFDCIVTMVVFYHIIKTIIQRGSRGSRAKILKYENKMNLFGLSFLLFILKWSAGKGFFYQIMAITLPATSLLQSETYYLE